MALLKLFMNSLDEVAERLTNMEQGFSQTGVSVGGEDIKLTYSPEYRELAEFVGIPVDKMNDNKENLEFMMEWSKAKAKSEDMVDAMYEIKKLREKLGFQEIGATAVKKMRQYIRLSDEQNALFNRIDKIKKEKELLNEPTTHGEHGPRDN